ncbi:MAG TPA: dienelactone hydrolase family protein [Herpetosiphonaceae bacterium]|nr:dienelactone hydrolase family protein [Herpetosiphonaceae bacterium]
MRDQLNDMQLYLIDEFVEDYQEGLLTRRDALRRIAAISGSLVFATTLLAACGEAATASPTAAGAAATPTTGAAAASPTAASAAAASPTAAPPPATPAPPDPEVSVAESDPAIIAQSISFPGQDATLMGYVSRPPGDGPFPLILVCHENRGLTDHIRDVTRRLAKAGYAAMAVDLLARQGGTAKIAFEDVAGVLGQLPEGQPAQDFQSALSFLQGQPFADKARVGMVGFCYGGGVTWRVATKTPELLAAVPFYGPAPKIEEVPGINAAVLAIYAEQDERINAGIPDIEAAMKQNNKTFEKVIYPGVNHAFHNDTGARYNREQAKAAWAKTLEWFGRYVRDA